jgi:hypothetical protein
MLEPWFLSDYQLYHLVFQNEGLIRAPPAVVLSGRLLTVPPLSRSELAALAKFQPVALNNKS